MTTRSGRLEASARGARRFHARETVLVAVAIVAMASCGAPAVTASPQSRSEGTAASEATCATSQLQITTISSRAGLGAVGAWLRFVNTGSEPCVLKGWPTLVGVTAGGATTVARDSTVGPLYSNVKGVPTVRLNPGDAALAEFDATDIPFAAPTCPPAFQVLRVTPPGNKQSVSVSGWMPSYDNYLPACRGLDVTVVVPASSVLFGGSSPAASGR